MKLTYTNEVLNFHHGQTDCEAGIYLDGEIVGLVTYVLFNKELTISHIFIRKEFRRQGYGSRLMKYIKQENSEYKYKPSWKTKDGAIFKHKDLSLTEHINFTRGLEPKIAMGIGIEQEIINWFEDSTGLPFDDVFDFNVVLEYVIYAEKIDYIKYLVDVKKIPITKDLVKIALKTKNKKIIDYIKSKRIVKESQNFMRGLDPMIAMNIGLDSKMKHLLNHIGIHREENDINKFYLLLAHGLEIFNVNEIKQLLDFLNVYKYISDDSKINELRLCAFKGALELGKFLVTRGFDLDLAINKAKELGEKITLKNLFKIKEMLKINEKE
ncbi:MAG: GNAT family N-acetyltransferase [Clostridia bacterium]